MHCKDRDCTEFVADSFDSMESNDLVKDFQREITLNSADGW